MPDNRTWLAEIAIELPSRSSEDFLGSLRLPVEIPTGIGKLKWLDELIF